MMSHGFFISLSYGLSCLGLFALAVKSYLDMKKTDKVAASLRRARRKGAGS